MVATSQFNFKFKKQIQLILNGRKVRIRFSCPVATNHLRSNILLLTSYFSHHPSAFSTSYIIPQLAYRHLGRVDRWVEPAQNPFWPGASCEMSQVNWRDVPGQLTWWPARLTFVNYTFGYLYVVIHPIFNVYMLLNRLTLYSWKPLCLFKFF